MSSLKELYHEILKTQQDIAVTYSRVVGVENELKKKLSEENKTESINERLNVLQQQLQELLSFVKPVNALSNDLITKNATDYDNIDIDIEDDVSVEDNKNSDTSDHVDTAENVIEPNENNE
ncbi:unknown [Choristoneura occidentalis granulovirus]|uniref:Uncharacterized protein n=1 Tax=Choristoneura occidentalis granulovirus TaxID=364745 RepID=Q1A4P7_9BBAC|nr:unknown [Choristoneura fumiferana granulovirus]ABC61183.1 unknown [Choristoneura fumiferana granulovirus]